MDNAYFFKPEEVANIQIELLIKILAIQEAMSVIIPEFICEKEEDKNEFISLMNERTASNSTSILHDLYERKGNIDINDILGKK